MNLKTRAAKSVRQTQSNSALKIPKVQKAGKKSNQNSSPPVVAIIMGSESDYETLRHAEDILLNFAVPYEISVTSAHRTPDVMFDYAKSAHERGLQVIIAGAGGAAHLPGMVSALCTLPVLGVPIESGSLRGLDSLLSIVQMPGGVPTATFAIGKSGATNAALFAIQILALNKPELSKKLRLFREDRAKLALSGNEKVRSRLPKEVYG
jgi:5-(carboxyamino)imidazole ribonucleotide mutase